MITEQKKGEINEQFEDELFYPDSKLFCNFIFDTLLGHIDIIALVDMVW